MKGRKGVAPRGRCVAPGRRCAGRSVFPLFRASTMIRHGLLCISLGLGIVSVSVSLAPAREAKLVRYPHYHDGKVVFSYLGDLWTAREDGKEIVRLTAHKARDVSPRFSPDGRWIAFSSDREGNLDVHLIPATGGEVKRLTVHSADDLVLGWTPDGKSVLFA